MNAYLDHHTATFPSGKALEKAHGVLKNRWISTLSPYAQEGRGEISQAEEAIRSMLGLNEGDKIYFTASHAEAVHAVLFSIYLETIRESGKNHILTSAIEDAATLFAFKRLETLGCATRLLKTDKRGKLTKALLEEGIKPRSSLFSFAYANPLTGVIHEVEELICLAKSKELLVHLDVSSILGKLHCSFEDLGVDFLTLNGALVHAPMGTSLIVVKNGIPFSPLIRGKASQDVAGILSLKIALEETLAALDHMTLEGARRLRLFEEIIQQSYPEALIIFEKGERLPHVTSITFPGVEAEALLFRLARKGVYATLGGGPYQKLSQILQIAEIEPLFAHSALSFTISYKTEEKELKDAAEAIVEEAKALRALSKDIIRESV